MKAATISAGFAASWDVFQSTPPVKAATKGILNLAYKLVISIHAAREGGDVTLADYKAALRISIHAAREGGDPADADMPLSPDISIHAAREGGDFFMLPRPVRRRHFNPRRP